MGIRHRLDKTSLDLLLRPTNHMPLLTKQRALMILERVRFIALFFALLTIIWIFVDAILLPWPIWGQMAIGRVLASIAFLMIGTAFRKSNRMAHAYFALIALFAIPSAFYIFSYFLIYKLQLSALSAVLASIYAFLPLIIVAGLGIFPLTAMESIVFALPVLFAEIFANWLGLDMLNMGQLLGATWLSLMLAVVAALCSMSQLGFIIQLIRQAIRDGLTDCFTRTSGEELLSLQFIATSRSGGPLSVAFVDIDNFKKINDVHGHEAGDKVLKEAAAHLRGIIRSGDMLVRWGGEEFVLILPGANCAEAGRVIERLNDRGLGSRPDGSRLTASIGIAERGLDDAEDYQHLVEIADQRMYQAKTTGKDRYVTHPSIHH